MKAKKYLHVNKHIIGRNNKTGGNEPAISVKSSKENLYGRKVKVFDQQGNLIVEFLQAHPSCGIKPLNCGAKIFGRFTDHARIEVEQ
jgi:hypothetical protein